MNLEQRAEKWAEKLECDDPYYNNQFRWTAQRAFLAGYRAGKRDEKKTWQPFCEDEKVTTK